jgi:hypothetical protein
LHIGCSCTFLSYAFYLNLQKQSYDYDDDSVNEDGDDNNDDNGNVKAFRIASCDIQEIFIKSNKSLQSFEYMRLFNSSETVL